MSRSSPAVWGRKGLLQCSQLLRPALQARRLRNALMLQVRIAQGEEGVGGGTRHRAHEERGVARLRAALLLWHMFIAKNAPMLWWYAASRREHHMLVCPGSRSPQKSASLAADPAVDSTGAAARDIISSQAGEQRRRLVKTSWSAAATKRTGQKRKKWAPGATWTRRGTQNFTRNTVKTCSALGARQETQQHVAQGQQTARSRSTKGSLLSSDLRTTRPPCEPHTTQSTETTLPPCRRSTILWLTEPSSRNCSAAPRALAPEAPGHLPRVVRSGCSKSEQMRPELWTNVCPP